MKAPITIENAQAVVRASSTEQFQLWCLYAEGSGYTYRVRKPAFEGGGSVPAFEDRRGAVAWVEQSLGFVREIGKVDGRPICVAVGFATINGIRVAFVDGCSQLVDHAMIEKWIGEAMSQAARHQADAMNWRNALLGLKPDPLPDLPDPPPPEPQPEPPPPGPFVLPESVELMIDNMLIAGGTLHAFRSGGGLRVVDLSVAGTRYYGEHPHLHEAMRILADDCDVPGGRGYSAVYGKLETHYLTGDSSPADVLDAWVLGGRTIDARAVDGQIEVSLRGIEIGQKLHEAVHVDDRRLEALRALAERGATAGEREAARVDRRSRSRSRRGGGRVLKGSCPSVTCGQGKGSALPSAGGPAQPEAALRRRCVSTSARSTRSSMSGPRRPTYLRVLARRAWWSRLQVLRAALLAHEAPAPRLLARRIRDLGPTAWLARQVDALLRRGDRWAAEVERALETELGPLLTGSTNPADEWRGATGRLRRIGPGAEGLRLRRVELEAEARAAGYDLQLQVRRRGRDAVVRSGPAPESQYLHGAIADAVVALWELGVVRSRLQAGWPARRALSPLIGSARGRGRS